MSNQKHRILTKKHTVPDQLNFTLEQIDHYKTKALIRYVISRKSSQQMLSGLLVETQLASGMDLHA